MKILLTGATGFIGSHLLKLLLEKQHQVVALKRKRSSASKLTIRSPLLRWHEIDERLPDLFAEESFDAVVHLAAIYGRKGEELGSLIEANVVFPLRLLQYSCQAGCRRFLHTDTFYSAGTNQYEYLREYILSKKQLADWCHIFARTHPTISFYNVRLEHVYGPSDRPDKFIPNLIEKLLANTPKLDLTSGEQLRDFVFVSDVAAAYLTLLEIDQPMPGYKEVRVGTGTSVSVRKMVELLKKLTGSSSQLNFGALPQRKGEIMDSSADIRYLTQHRWQASIPLENGLLQTIRSMPVRDCLTATED